MILENHGETTRNKYICKFVEYVLYDSSKEELTLAEIHRCIFDRFQLEFDLLEIKNAIATKGKKRILEKKNGYQLTPKANSELSTQISASERLKKSILTFINQNDVDITADRLLALIQKYLYYCFNSTAQNFSLIISDNNTNKSIDFGEVEFKPSDDEIDIINKFILWDNTEKNKLFYSIVSSCYEYCLITSKTNVSFSNSIFKDKVFFLDTNIIFRMAGINNDERKFVIGSFVKKCKEVGITLCYTNTVLSEIGRVVEAQVQYIKAINRGQPPISEDALRKLTEYEYESNDFYSIYYNWCKEPQNKYDDYISFKRYLEGLITNATKNLKYIDTSKFPILENNTYFELHDNLREYKNSKRPKRPVSKESIRTDISQILYLQSLRSDSVNSLWEINEYTVSADQLLVSWAEKTFEGVPLVVIPSVWLSVILKISGRATNDDYKSFCLFLTLRHHHLENDDLNINPIELLSRLSEKTIDATVKEQIITEIMSNRNEYVFDDLEEYDSSIEKAFDKLLADEHKKAQEILNKDQTDKKSEDLISILAKNKADKNVDFFAERRNVLLIIKAALWGVFIIIGIYFVLDLFVVMKILSINFDILNIGSTVLSFAFEIPIAAALKYIDSIWNYLSSEERRSKLYKKNMKKQQKIIDYSKNRN